MEDLADSTKNNSNRNKELDIDTYELIDESLGVYNTNMLEYCNINDINTLLYKL